MATLSASPEYQPRDHSRLAGTYLIVLGVLSLLSLHPLGVSINLGGILFIWFGVKVREHHDGFRKASLWLVGLCLAGGIFVLAWASAFGTEGVTVTLLEKHEAPLLWLVYAVGVPTLIIFALPFYWLWQDSYLASREPEKGIS